MHKSVLQSLPKAGFLSNNIAQFSGDNFNLIQDNYKFCVSQVSLSAALIQSLSQHSEYNNKM